VVAQVVVVDLSGSQVVVLVHRCDV
jgi:hypothetical protein